MTKARKTKQAPSESPSGAQASDLTQVSDSQALVQCYRKRAKWAFILGVICYCLSFLSSIALIVTSVVIAFQPAPSFFQKAFATAALLIGSVFILFFIRSPFSALQNYQTQASRVHMLLVTFQTLQDALRLDLERMRAHPETADPAALEEVFLRLNEGVEKITKALFPDDWLNM